ncbi:MAG: hypothetical protein Q4G34_04600 [Micrococcus sp.]|nr:hypothetical protein [Micrococcus sp.]
MLELSKNLGIDGEQTFHQALPPMCFNLSADLHWVELLHDLGGYARDMADMTGDHDLQYQQISRQGDTASITVTNGRRAMTFTRDLVTAEFPIAVPIDLASDFMAGQRRRR